MRKRCDPEYGDVLVVGRGNSIGRISIVNSNKVFCLLGSVILLKHKNDKIHNTYLFFYLQSPKVFEQLINTSSHSVQPTIYLEGIKNQIVILPPLSEQEQIVSYLDEKTSQIDKTIDIEKKKIELLKEYRQSLISNVVTGKIKVTE
jgi:type I restriction enzyme S subunit